MTIQPLAPLRDLAQPVAPAPARRHRALKIFGERHCGTAELAQLLAGISSAQILPGTADALSRSHAALLRPATLALGALGKDRRKAREQLTDWVFAITPDTLSWTHCATLFDSASAFTGTFVVFCVRHPMTWLDAMLHRPHHALVDLPKTVDAFIHLEWPTLGRERLAHAVLRPLDLYERKLASYLRFAAQLQVAGIACAIIRYEDLMARPGDVLARLGPHLAGTQATLTPTPVSAPHEIHSQSTWRPAGSESLWPVAAQFGYAPP